MLLANADHGAVRKNFSDKKSRTKGGELSHNEHIHVTRFDVLDYLNRSSW